MAKECIYCQSYSDSAKCKAFKDDCLMWLRGECPTYIRKEEKWTKVDFLWSAFGKPDMKEGDISKKGV